MSLIEIVEIKHQVAFWRGIEAKVAKVSVAADDRQNSGSGQTGEVLDHQAGRPSQKRVRRGHHPTNSHRYQTFQATRMRHLDEIYRVRPIFLGSPKTQIAAFHH